MIMLKRKHIDKKEEKVKEEDSPFTFAIKCCIRQIFQPNRASFLLSFFLLMKKAPQGLPLATFVLI